MNGHIESMYELMRKESNRLKTFQMNPPWPKDYVDIKSLAKAGFFYAFNGDNVHCAFCHGQVCRWERGDDPMSEHARHFTTCPFIMGGEVGNEPLGEDPFPGPKRPRPYDVCGIYQNPPPIQQSYNNNEDHQRLDLPNIQQPLNHRTPAYDDISPDTQIQHSPVSSNNSNCSNSSSGGWSGICKICYTNSIELVFLPCGHSVSCLSCAQRLYCCPYCRATITTRIRTYFV